MLDSPQAGEVALTSPRHQLRENLILVSTAHQTTLYQCSLGIPGPVRILLILATQVLVTWMFRPCHHLMSELNGCSIPLSINPRELHTELWATHTSNLQFKEASEYLA